MRLTIMLLIIGGIIMTGCTGTTIIEKNTVNNITTINNITGGGSNMTATQIQALGFRNESQLNATYYLKSNPSNYMTPTSYYNAVTAYVVDMTTDDVDSYEIGTEGSFVRWVLYTNGGGSGIYNLDMYYAGLDGAASSHLTSIDTSVAGEHYGEYYSSGTTTITFHPLGSTWAMRVMKISTG